MKKMMAVICCTAMLALCLMGCGNKVDLSGSSYLGNWTATTCEYEGFEMNVSDVVGEFSITLNADGSFGAVVGEEEQSGTWEEVENGIKLDGDEEMVFQDNGGNLDLEYDDVLMHFEKK